jgi:hypothetical protein
MKKLLLLSVLAMFGCAKSDQEVVTEKTVITAKRTPSEAVQRYYDFAEKNDTTLLYAASMPSGAARVRGRQLRDEKEIYSFTPVSERIDDIVKTQAYVDGYQFSKSRETDSVLRIDTITYILNLEAGEWKVAISDHTRPR